jgi:hypothetical protein
MEIFGNTVMMSNFLLTGFCLKEFRLQACEKSGSSSLQGNLGSYCVLFFVCVPFAARGDKGEEEYP